MGSTCGCGEKNEAENELKVESGVSYPLFILTVNRSLLMYLKIMKVTGGMSSLILKRW